MQKIVPCIWFEDKCEDAMEFYVKSFSGISGGEGDSKIISIQKYEEGMQTPGIEKMVGKVLTGIFELEGFRFMALDGGPYFKLNASKSFMLNFDPSKNENAKEKLEQLWKELSEGGKVLMELSKYPFSELYGWLEDKYGVSWQLILSDPKGEPRPFVVPSLLFVNEAVGKAEAAGKYYVDTFKNSNMGRVARYPKGVEPDKEGTIMYSDFMLENQWFSAMDSAREHDFSFNESISYVVNCKDQAEVDELWTKLSKVPESEQCGWCKDQFGVSWQIIPEKMGELLGSPDREKAQKATNAMLQMKKINQSKLEDAFNS